MAGALEKFHLPLFPYYKMHQYLFPISAAGNTLDNQPLPYYQKWVKTVLAVRVHEHMIYLNENESPPAIKYAHKLREVTPIHTLQHIYMHTHKKIISWI